MSRPLVFLLDPGHGGNSYPGETSYLLNLQEKELALRLAEMIAERVDKKHEICFTRFKDEHVSLRERARMAIWADLTISLHFHNVPNRRANFFEIQGTISPYSKQFGQKLLSDLKTKLGLKNPLCQYLPTISRIGWKSRSPVVRFVDHFSNRAVERELADDSRLITVADGISDCVNRHLATWNCKDPY